MNLERSIVISNKYGLHARASTKLAQLAKQFRSRVSLARDSAPEDVVDAKSILGVLTLGAEKGQNLRVCIEGDDAESAMAAILDLFARKFDEE